ncbi:hypothetical protein GW17_00051284, partial [Ensete ventricosum]
VVPIGDVSAGAASTRRWPAYGRRAHSRSPLQEAWLLASTIAIACGHLARKAAALAKGLAVGGRPCRRPTRRWLPSSSLPSSQILARIRRTVLRDSISSYAIKELIYCTNNLGSDTTVRKPQ